jgi:chemotaxis signal transduction protein
MASSSSLVHTRPGKYVAFQIARRYFVVEAQRVRTVAPASSLRPLEDGLDLVKGTVHVNGRELPVVDLRARLGLAGKRPRPQASVIVLEVGANAPRAHIGVLADKLTDVLEVRERDIRGNVVQLRCAGKPYGRPKVLLDLERLVTEEELTRLRALGA